MWCQHNSSELLVLSDDDDDDPFGVSTYSPIDDRDSDDNLTIMASSIVNQKPFNLNTPLSFVFPSRHQVHACAYNSQGTRLAFGAQIGGNRNSRLNKRGSQNGDVVVMCAVNVSSIRKEYHIEAVSFPRDIRFSPDGQLLTCSCSENSDLVCYDVTDGSILLSFEFESHIHVNAIVFSNQDQNMLAACCGNHLVIFELSGLTKIGQFKVDADIVTCTFTPDGTILLYSALTPQQEGVLYSINDLRPDSIKALPYNARPKEEQKRYLVDFLNIKGESQKQASEMPLGKFTLLAHREEVVHYLDLHPMLAPSLLAMWNDTSDAKRLLAACEKYPELSCHCIFANDGAGGSVLACLARMRDRQGCSKLLSTLMFHQLKDEGQCLSAALLVACDTMPDAVPGLLKNLERFVSETELHTVSLPELPRIFSDIIDPVAVASHLADPVDVWKSKERTRGVEAVCHRTPCAGLGSARMLDGVLRTRRLTAFDNNVMALVIDEMWKAIQKMFFFRFVLYIFFVLAISGIAACTAGQDLPFVKPHHLEIAAAGFGVGHLVFSALHTTHESISGSGTSATSTAFLNILRARALDIWNLLDMMTYTSLFILLWARTQGHSLLEQMMISTTTLLTYSNMLQYLRGFQQTAPMVMMVVTILIDITPFMLVLFVTILGFSLNLWVFLTPQDGFTSLSEAIFSTILMGILGDFETDVFDNSESPSFARFLFLTLMFVVLIVLLNLLIALMTSSYEKVMDAYSSTLRCERAKIISEQLHLLGMIAPNYFRRIEHDTMYFHRLVPESLDAGYEEEGSWHGQVSAVKDTIKREGAATLIAVQDAVKSGVQLQMDVINKCLQAVEEKQDEILQMDVNKRLHAVEEKQDEILKLLKAGAGAGVDPKSLEGRSKSR